MIKELLGNSSDIFSAIGAITTGVIAFKVALWAFRFLTAHFLSSILGLSANVKKAGSWAVVTGSTDGIGKAYVEGLAAKGMNMVLISRTKAKLEQLAEEIGAKFNVSTKIIAVDFSCNDFYGSMKADLENLDIGVLVNNVGMSYEYPEYFAEVDDPDFARKMIHMNCTSVAKMTEIVLPGMVEKKAGYIINIGSGAGSSPTPFLSLYSGTKAFVDLFSTSLSAEYAGKGIVVQCVKPYFVVTKMSRFRKSSLFVPSPTTFVTNALSTLGVQSNTTGYWAHAIQDVYMKLIPTSLTVTFLKQARAKALKKKVDANKKE